MKIKEDEVAKITCFTSKAFLYLTMLWKQPKTLLYENKNEYFKILFPKCDS